MKNKTHMFLLIIGLLSIACSIDADADTTIQDNIITEKTAENLYFPPLNSTEWETIPMTELKWNEVASQALYTFLEEKSTNAVIVLKNGKIAVEWYGTDFTQKLPMVLGIGRKNIDLIYHRNSARGRLFSIDG